ncbi:MAG: tetratricopeptide repeat protein, partial [Deltaproteobacteria bacterium]|nr:tetratricopeptide repeat protein [Deltaproteobacteria bacterium]
MAVPASAQQAGMDNVKPTSPADAYYERGARALRLGRTEEALQNLAAAARLAPDDPAILSAYAKALIDAGRQDDALTILKQARGTRSVDEDLALGVVSLELKQWDAAEGHLRKAVERDPSNGASQIFLATALIEQGKLDEAEPVLTEAVNRDPWLASRVEFARGRIAMERGQRATAEEHFRRAKQLEPDTMLGAMAGQTLGRPEPRSWSFFASAGMAFDSNANIAGEDDRFSRDRDSDYRIVAEVGADWDVIRGDKFNLRLGANAFTSRHGDNRDFDLLTTRAFGIAAYELTSQLTADARYTFEYVWTDPAGIKEFRRTHLVEPSLRWRPRQDLLTRALYRWEGRHFLRDRNDIPLRVFPFPFQNERRTDPLDRDGDIQIVGLEQYWFMPDYTGWGRGFIRGSFRWRSESTDGGDFDTHGPVANVLIGQPLPWQVYLLLEGEYDDRTYTEVSSIGLLTELQTDRRKDEIWRARVLLRRPITDSVTA